MAQADAFGETLDSRQGRNDMIDGELSQVFSRFDGNVEMETEAYPEIACREGCATCCTLRVTATAPEVLLIERFLRWPEFPGRKLNLAKRLEKRQPGNLRTKRRNAGSVATALPFHRAGCMHDLSGTSIGLTKPRLLLPTGLC